MQATEMLRDAPCIFGFVESRLLETDREGAHRDRRIFLVERTEGRTVDAARQESSDWDVGHRLALDRAGQHPFQFRERIVLVENRVRQPCLYDLAIGPEAL